MAAAATEALQKIAAVVPADMARAADGTAIHAFRSPDLDPACRSRLDALDAAVQSRVRLRLSYVDEAGAPTQRDVRPLGLVFCGKVWTLIAWCDLRDDFRMFRVDRIASAQPGERFPPKPRKSLKAFYARECLDGDVAPARDGTSPRAM